MGWFHWLEHILVTIVLAALLRTLITRGWAEASRVFVVALQAVPGVEWLIKTVLKNEVTTFIKKSVEHTKDSTSSSQRVIIPTKGVPADQLLAEMKEMKKKDADHSKGKVFAYIYTLENDHFHLQKDVWDLFEEKSGISPDHDALMREFHHAFMQENALNPMAYPSHRKMETEVVSMGAAMLNGGSEAVGFLTSGGTESVVMAVKTYRDRAKKLYPQIKRPNIVAPITIHPCFEKAAHYFGLDVKHAPVGADKRADVKELEKLIDTNTILLAASAPQYCHGIVDPVEDISKLALKHGLPLHVDACFGGFMLPWVEKLGYPIPKFDFRCPGVTSMSADCHKYGYCTKGSSLIIYRNDEYRKHQIFSYVEWPGGLYGSHSMAGSRPAGNIASTWASMRYLGQEGYLDIARKLMNVTIKMKEAVRNIPGLYVIGEPHMTSLAVGSSDQEVNIQAVGDVMEEDGWKVERQQKPDCLHFTILPSHIAVVDDVISALSNAVKKVKENKTLGKQGTAALYGMVATIPDKAIVKDFLVEFFSQVYKTT